MLNFNEKRPERVLSKGAYQEVVCSNCQTLNKTASHNTACLCEKCGQQLNWGLRKN
jgi:PHP family Zn ribbon phosphoesterase